MAEQNIRYIDLTPTNREATAIYIAVIENYASQKNPSPGLCKAYDDARLELMRYATILDRINEEQKND